MSRPIVRSSTHTPEGITFEYVLSRAEIKMDKDGKIKIIGKPLFNPDEVYKKG